MLKYILFILILVNISYASGKQYFIQLGSYKQLNILERTINRLPAHLRSHIVIVQSNSWFIPFAYHTSNRYALERKLSDYKRYFVDAYINDSPYIRHHSIVRNYTNRTKKYRRANIPKYQNVAISQEDNTVAYINPVLRETYIPKPTRKRVKVVHKKYKQFNKKMLSGKHYYLAYKSTENSPDLLIRVNFENHSVHYQPVMGDMQMRDARYIIDNKRLYMFADSFSKDGAFSKIDKHQKDYILVSSWANGKKLNTLRYYYRLNDAKNYLGEKSSSDPLAKALEDSEIEGVYLPNY